MKNLNILKDDGLEENVNINELFPTDSELSQSQSQSSQIPIETTTPRTPPILRTEEENKNKKEKIITQTSSSPSLSSPKRRRRSKRKSDISISDLESSQEQYSNNSNKKRGRRSKKTKIEEKTKQIIENELKSTPIKERLRSHSKSASPKSSSTISLSATSTLLTKQNSILKLNKHRDSSKPITLKSTSIKNKKRKVRGIITTPLPVNDLSQSSQFSQEGEESGEMETEKEEEEKEEEEKEEEEKEEEEKEEEEKEESISGDDDFEDEEEEDDEDDEIIKIKKNNKVNLIIPPSISLFSESSPQSPITEPDSPVEPTQIIKPPPLPLLISTNIIKPTPKRITPDLINMKDVVVNKCYKNYDDDSNNIINKQREAFESKFKSFLSNTFEFT